MLPVRADCPGSDGQTRVCPFTVALFKREAALTVSLSEPIKPTCPEFFRHFWPAALWPSRSAFPRRRFSPLKSRPATTAFGAGAAKCAALLFPGARPGLAPGALAALPPRSIDPSASDKNVTISYGTMGFVNAGQSSGGDAVRNTLTMNGGTASGLGGGITALGNAKTISSSSTAARCRTKSGEVSARRATPWATASASAEACEWAIPAVPALFSAARRMTGLPAATACGSAGPWIRRFTAVTAQKARSSRTAWAWMTVLHLGSLAATVFRAMPTITA